MFFVVLMMSEPLPARRTPFFCARAACVRVSVLVFPSSVYQNCFASHRIASSNDDGVRRRTAVPLVCSVLNNIESPHTLIEW
jgi:hypothetical protein